MTTGWHQAIVVYKYSSPPHPQILQDCLFVFMISGPSNIPTTTRVYNNDSGEMKQTWNFQWSLSCVLGSWAASRIKQFSDGNRNTPLVPIWGPALSLPQEVAWQGLKPGELGHEKDSFTGPGFSSPLLPVVGIYHHTLHCRSSQGCFGLFWSVIVSAELEKGQVGMGPKTSFITIFTSCLPSPPRLAQGSLWMREGKSTLIGPLILSPLSY